MVSSFSKYCSTPNKTKKKIKKIKEDVPKIQVKKYNRKYKKNLKYIRKFPKLIKDYKQKFFKEEEEEPKEIIIKKEEPKIIKKEIIKEKQKPKKTQKPKLHTHTDIYKYLKKMNNRGFLKMIQKARFLSNCNYNLQSSNFSSEIMKFVYDDITNALHKDDIIYAIKQEYYDIKNENNGQHIGSFKEAIKNLILK